MKNKIWLWIIKISVAFLWVFSLFIPDIYLMIHGEETFVIKEVATEQNGEVRVFDVEYSEDVIYGHIDVGFYDINGNWIYGQTHFFGDNYSKFLRMEFENEKIANSVDYKLGEFYAKSVNERKVDIISAVLATIMLVGVIIVLRIDYEEKVVGGKTVTVYSGIIKHRVKIDGKTVFDKKWFTFKGREVVLNVGENSDIKVLFDAMNKIKFETIDEAENSADNNSHKNDNDEENNK